VGRSSSRPGHRGLRLGHGLLDAHRGLLADRLLDAGLLTNRLLGAVLLATECDAELRDHLRELLARESEPARECVGEQLRVGGLDVLSHRLLSGDLLAELAADGLPLLGEAVERNLLGLHRALLAPEPDYRLLPDTSPRCHRAGGLLLLCDLRLGLLPELGLLGQGLRLLLLLELGLRLELLPDLALAGHCLATNLRLLDRPLDLALRLRPLELGLLDGSGLLCYVCAGGLLRWLLATRELLLWRLLLLLADLELWLLCLRFHRGLLWRLDVRELLGLLGDLAVLLGGLRLPVARDLAGRSRVLSASR
jgi:hypothetical protein